MVKIPGSIKVINESTFYNCGNLRCVEIDDGVSAISRNAFAKDMGINDVKIPNSVTFIDDSAFMDCLIRNITVPQCVCNVRLQSSGTAEFDRTFPSIFQAKFPQYASITNLVIADGVSNIGAGAFEDCSGIKSVVVSESVTNIGVYAFNNCDNLVEILIPPNVKSIGKNAFSNCSSLNSVYLSKTYNRSISNVFPASTHVFRYKPIQVVTFQNIEDAVIAVESISVEYKKKYGNLPMPSRNGYTFLCWELSGSTITADSIVDALDNHSLNAMWEANNYTVSFDAGCESQNILDDKNVFFGGEYGDLPMLSQPGYTFNGWFCNNTQVSSESIVNTPSNHVLIAHWSRNKYPMTFNANGGDGGCTLMQDYDTPVAAPVVSRAGYSFTGWSPSILTNVPAESLEFVAQWTANNYEVSFDLAGGIGEFDPLTLSYDGNYGELPVPEREGYAFQGWSLNDNMVNADTILATSSNHVLTAVWQGNEYIVSLDAKGGIVEPGTKSVVYGDEYGDLPIPVREGYDFVAWLCNGHVIESDTVVSTSSNHTFVASWDANQYQVSFDPKGGNLQGGSDSKIVTYDAEYGELPEPSRVGYTFGGWTLGDEEISSMSVVTTACNHTLSAAWTANKYVVELNSNEGTLDPELSTIEVVFDSAYGVLPQPERVGYGFVGWATSMIGGEVIGPDSLATTNQVLYALWEANQYQIVYDANNDSGETYAADAVYDDDVEIAENPFVWLAHVFVGWSDSPDGEVVYEPEEIVRNLTAEPDGEVTLYAVWEPLVVAAPAVSPGDGTSFIEDVCLVTITCATEGADIYYSTKGTPPRIRESYLYTGTFEISGTTQIMAVAEKEGVMSELSVVTISRRELTIPEAAGAVELPFETGGDAEWEPTADKTSPNGLSVESGTIGCAEYGSSNVTWLVTSAEGAGTLSFQWKVDCEHDYTGMCLWDHFVVSTNGVEVTRIDGSQDWAQVSLSFGNGSNVIRWAFVKDDEDDDSAPFEDRAWISCVTWTPAVIIEDTTYDADEMPEMVAAHPGVTLRVKVETEPTADEIAALMARVAISPKSAEQSSDYFKVVGTYDPAIESVTMSVVIDEEAIELNCTATEILDAVMNKSFAGGEVTIQSAKQGLWYGIVVVDDLCRLNEAAESVSFVQAGEDGVKIDITRPEGPTAFCKIVVRDEGSE